MFNGCKKLQSISLPDTIRRIGNDAFQYCACLKEIIIPEGSSTLQQGDSVIIISRNSGITNLNEIYQDGAPGSAGGVK